MNVQLIFSYFATQSFAIKNNRLHKKTAIHFIFFAQVHHQNKIDLKKRIIR